MKFDRDAPGPSFTWSPRAGWRSMEGYRIWLQAHLLHGEREFAVAFEDERPWITETAESFEDARQAAEDDWAKRQAGILQPRHAPRWYLR